MNLSCMQAAVVRLQQKAAAVARQQAVLEGDDEGMQSDSMDAMTGTHHQNLHEAEQEMNQLQARQHRLQVRHLCDPCHLSS